MTGSPRTLRVLAMTLLLFCASLPTAAQVPGDACATAQQYKVNGGPETLGLVHMMVCDGGTWKSIVSSNAAGEVTKIGNQTCANGDFFKYDGTKLICTTAGGAALSSLTAAIADNSINNGNWNQVWNWQLAAGEIGFTFGENIASAGGSADQYILAAKTLATSTATPFMITNLGAAASFRVNDETGDADTTPFVIDASGNVGIGTATPENKFHLAENLPAPGIATLRINNTANQSSSQIVFEESNQGDNFTIRYNTDNAMLGGNENYLEFLANGVTPVMILDRGNPVYGVGVGTPIGYPPAAKLEVRNSGTEDILNLYDGATEVLTVLDGGNVGIGTTSPASKFVVAPPASAAVAGGGTITADACGTIKQITSTGNVTTNTTNTFTAPTASYAGCCMTVINVDTADTITLDANTLFKTIGGANQALNPSDAVEVCSNGTNWYQIGAVSANQ